MRSSVALDIFERYQRGVFQLRPFLGDLNLAFFLRKGEGLVLLHEVLSRGWRMLHNLLLQRFSIRIVQLLIRCGSRLETDRVVGQVLLDFDLGPSGLRTQRPSFRLERLRPA